MAESAGLRLHCQAESHGTPAVSAADHIDPELIC